MKSNNKNGFKKGQRSIDEITRETYSWWGRSIVFIKRTRIKTWKAVFIIAFVAGAATALIWSVSLKIQTMSDAAIGAELSLVATNQTVIKNNPFNVEIDLNTHSNNVVAVKAIVNYNPLDFSLTKENVDTRNGSFAIDRCPSTGNPTGICSIVNVDSAKGQATITVAKPAPGIVGDALTVAKLTFTALRAVTPTTPNITLSYTQGSYTDSDVIVNDGSGSDILSGAVGTSITVVPPACTAFNYSAWSTCGYVTEGYYQTRTVTSSTPTSCTGSPDPDLLIQSCSAPACSSFTYSNWGSCQQDNKQYRTVISASPIACQGGNPQLSQSCTYTPPVCTEFTYSDWGACQPNNKKYRTIVSSLPAGCKDGNAILENSCVYNGNGETCTSFTYSDWGDCQIDNKQYRTVITALPENCMGGDASLSRSCTYTPPVCSDFTYSDWGVCQTDNQKYRSVASSLPAGCQGGNPQLSQSCTYTPPVCTEFTYTSWEDCTYDEGDKTYYQFRDVTSSLPFGCQGGNSDTQRECDPPTCSSFTYNDWSACQSNGTKNRTVATSSPIGCTGGNPDLNGTCIYDGGTTSVICSNFTYSDWNTCQPNGTQSRTIASTSPDGCTGGNPTLTQSCNYVGSSSSNNNKKHHHKKKKKKKKTTVAAVKKVAGDKTGPVLQIPLLLNKNRGDRIWWTGSDASGISYYTYKFRNSTVRTVAPSFNIPVNTPSGIYFVTIRAYDRAGNGSMRIVTIRVR